MQAFLISIAAIVIAFGLGRCSGHNAGFKEGEAAGNSKAAEARKELAESRAAVAGEREKRYAEVTHWVTTSTAAALQHRDQLAAARGRVEIRTVTLIEKVKDYVTEKADSQCTVPRGFVCLHDAALSHPADPAGAAAAGACESPDAAAGIPLSAVGAVVAHNNGTGVICCSEARRWRDWYVEMTRLHEHSGPPALPPDTSTPN